MECNKEEAEKCKVISEASLQKLDLAAARRFALKAKQLFPELDGLAQLLSMLDVYIAAQEKLRNGESNWYAILQVDFRADENTIRKQYRKLALFLHPDKNKAFGAEAAFKHISEAWSVLSDGKKKSDYDKRWFAHMAARMRSPYTPHNSPGVRARENISKQPMHGPRQCLRSVHQDQLHKLSQQGQSQRPANVHVQRHEPTPVYIHQQQGQNHQHQGNRQGQRHMHAHQQQAQRQGTAHANLHQWYDQTHVQQKVKAHAHHQEQGQVHAHQKLSHGQQEGQGQAYAHRQQQQAQFQQEQGQACAQQQGQGEVHAHQQQDHGQKHGGHQGQGQAHAHKQQQGQACAQQQDKVHVQQQGQSHQQQQELQHEAESTEHNQANVSKSSFAHEKSAFWTACPYCKMQLEYNIAYMNKKLCCPMCYKPFVSKEIEPIQGPIVWPYPKQQHKEALQEDVGKKICPVEEVDRMPKAVSSMPEILHPEKKTNRGKKDSSTQQNCQQVPKSTICAEERRVKQKQKQEQKKKVRLQSEFKVRTNCVERLLATIDEVMDQESLKERDNPGADKTSARLRRVNAVEENINDAYECNLRVVSNQISAGQRATRSEGIKGLSANMNSTAAIQAPACKQSILTATKQKACAGNMEEGLNNADDCNPRKRTYNSARKMELVNKKAPASMLFVPTIPTALNQGNMKGKANGVDDSRGSRKVSCLSKLGSSKMDVSQQKRKLQSSPIDGLEDTCILKRLRQSSNQVDNGSESDQLLDHSKSSDESFLQANGANNFPVECEMEVPDSDFYNFDEDRTEKHFAIGQIWATYDDDDGMPRYYARINKILSIQPLKMQMNWLEARNPTDAILAWLKAGFQHTCGDFKLGSVYLADQVSTFSHRMAVDKTSKGVYKIYPRRGDVWAVYKEWELLKVSDDNRGYDMVEIIANFDEKRGVQVAPLVKVVGFKTIFERKLGEEYLNWVSMHEIRRFSHQVPAHPIVAGAVPGIEVDCCLEIDPASTPMNLIVGEQ